LVNLQALGGSGALTGGAAPTARISAAGTRPASPESFAARPTSATLISLTIGRVETGRWAKFGRWAETGRWAKAGAAALRWARSTWPEAARASPWCRIRLEMHSSLPSLVFVEPAILVRIELLK
jgi:hypothetical protein